MISIKTQLILHIQGDQYKGRKTNGKTDYIDKRIAFVLVHISQSYLQIVLKHHSSRKKSQLQCFRYARQRIKPYPQYRFSPAILKGHLFKLLLNIPRITLLDTEQAYLL